MAIKQFGVDYAAAAALTGTETLSIVQGGVTVDTTTQDIADLGGGGGGSGDVVGPASAVDGDFALFDGVSGTLIKASTVAATTAILQGSGLDAAASGFRGIPQNSQSGNYTCVAADAGKEIYHPSGAGAGDTFTIPDNGSVAYEIGAAITFTNMDSNSLTIAITTDTLYLAGAGTTGSRTLAQYGTATAVKKTSTTWLITGVGIT